MLDLIIRTLTSGRYRYVSKPKPPTADELLQKICELQYELNKLKPKPVPKPFQPDHKIHVRQWYPFGVAMCYSLKFQVCAGHRRGQVVMWRCPGNLLNDYLTEAYNVQCGRAYYENADGTERPKRVR